MTETKPGMTRVRVRFLDSIAGAGDPVPAQLEEKYRNMSDELLKMKEGKMKKYTEQQVRVLVDDERKRDAAIIRSGFAKQFSFKVGDEATVNVEIAKHWEDASICSILPEQTVAKAA
jgi:hypothetical protein